MKESEKLPAGKVYIYIIEMNFRRDEKKVKNYPRDFVPPFKNSETSSIRCHANTSTHFV